MKKRILLISRETVTRNQLCQQLQMKYYDLRGEASLQGAVHSVDAWQPDLLLIDLEHSPFDPLGLLAQTAVVNPALPAVGLTERTDVLAAAARSGLSAVAEKPVDVDGLVRVMEELLARDPKERGGIRVVPRRFINLQGNFPLPPAESRFGPEPYRGWGIND